MKRITILLLTFSLLLILNAEVWAAQCAPGMSCAFGSICINKGDGDLCYKSCRGDDDCPATCCILNGNPRAFICGTKEECGIEDPEPDGEEDGDADTSEGSAEGDVCGSTVCADDEACVAVEPNQPVCLIACEEDADCRSECCVLFDGLASACLPVTEACPANREWNVPLQSTDTKVNCSQTGYTPWLMVLVFALFWRFRRARVS